LTLELVVELDIHQLAVELEAVGDLGKELGSRQLAVELVKEVVEDLDMELDSQQLALELEVVEDLGTELGSCQL
jgi:hypothetical protein